MSLSVVTVSHRSDRQLPRYVDSFLDSRSGRGGAEIEFVVVENSGHGDADAMLDPLRRAGFPVTFLQVDNRGFGAGCNVGAARASGRTLIFANPDLAFIDALDAIDARADDRTWGTVTQEDSEGRAYAFDILPEYKTVLGELQGRYRSFTPADAVWRDRLYPVGSFFIVAKSLFRAAGGFDERFFMYHEEAELSRRLHRLAGPPTLFEEMRVFHEAFGSETSRDATLRREARGLLTYAAITGERRILRTRALTQALMSPLSSGARRRLRFLVEELRAARRERGQAA
ncbi:glycosyltransferase [uncultured Sphingomonas sp.]|uniref:glycosyltransferase n=1 Tax=uncultured Sphingomonas sp. TaxID=158754 RepID=UPI0035CC3C99